MVKKYFKKHKNVWDPESIQPILTLHELEKLIKFYLQIIQISGIFKF